MYKTIKGFTLIELIVVMGVLAILITGLFTVLNPVERNNQANDTKALSDAQQVGNAFQTYAAGNSGLYPAKATACVYPTDLTAPLSTELTKMPTAKTNYTYTCALDSTGTTARIVTNLLSTKSKVAAGGSTTDACGAAAGANAAKPVAYYLWDSATSNCYKCGTAAAIPTSCP